MTNKGLDEQKMKNKKRRKRVMKKFWKRYKFICIIFIMLLTLLIISVIACSVNFVDMRKAEQVNSESTDIEYTQENHSVQSVESETDGEPQITPEILEEAEVISITVSAVGDCTLGTDKNFSTNTNFTSVYNKQGNPGYFFEKVKPVLENDDLTIANLEGTFTDSDARVNKTYAFKGDPSYTAILTEGSVEAVNLANNHSRDYGEESYTDTIDYLNQAGVASFGYEQTAVIDVNGVSVGLVGILELFTGYDAEEDLRKNLEKVKNEGAELIIVSFHWGTEKHNYPDDIQKTLGHLAIDEGAHLVIGHHPHVLQGIEEYKGRNIVYSLGNFCFGGNKNPSDKDTMIFQQTFSVENGEVWKDNEKQVIPCSLSSVSSHNNYQPCVLEGDEAQRVLDKIDKFSEGF